jgi:aminoglycoside phosphotransferase (APT) family kinase protein
VSASALLRAHHVVQAAHLDRQARPDGSHAGHLERVMYALNEVWRYGPYIVRINPQPGATRLQREGRLLRALPAEVRAPRPLAAGPAAWGEWMVVGCLPGVELAKSWRGLRRSERRRSITELAECLEALHGVDAPHVRAGERDADSPHPLNRLDSMLAAARRLPTVDHGVLDAAADKLHSAVDALDDDPATLVHGDLHFENVLIDDEGSVTGLLDFEWCRAGPPDLDLDILLHSLADPSLHVASGDGATLERSDFDDVVGWLGAAYPALLAHPRLPERLWVYRLSHELRSLLEQPPPPGIRGSSLPAHHPYLRIVRLVEGRSELGWFVGT